MKRALVTISCLTGMTSIVFVLLAVTAIASPAQTFTTLVNFDMTNGADPGTSLIQGTDGNFYGTTFYGGANGSGTVFQITAEGALTTLYSFCAQSSCTDGANPTAALVQGTDGDFYGTTGFGGVGTGHGTVFKITPSGTLTTLHIFVVSDGAVPTAALVQGSDGNFYGTTEYGGSNNLGTVFKMTPAGTLTTLYTFAGTDGSYPYAGLVQGSDGNFYGTTMDGGTNNLGTVFEITLAGTLTTLHSFNNTDGAYPIGGLAQGADGNFYGTTDDDGPNNYGTVFEITPAGTLTTLHSFNNTDGAYPEAGLAQGTDGDFYGTTELGGSSGNCSGGGCGTVFKMTSTGTLTTLHSFDGTDGAITLGLVQAKNGIFYGATFRGGTSSNCGTVGCGTVFSLELAPGAVTLSPTSLTFAPQATSTTSAAKNITLTNTGTVSVAISNVAINGDFAVLANTCGATLAVGKKCKISVTFTPTQLGPLAGTLTITDNADNSPQTVALSGTGVPSATLTPATATYATQAVGTTSSPKTFTLTNNQTITLTSIAISTTGDFAVSATACATSLAPKGKCTISVTFSPTTTGNRTGQLSVSDSADNSPQTVPLTGTGVVPATLTPASATYAAQAEGTTSLPKTFTLTNNQTVTLTGIAISTTGDFAVSATTCGTSLAAKAKCTISVTFTPTAIGTRTGQLSVSDSASNSPQTSNLTGTGITPATLTPASATYVAQKVGTTSLPKTFTLTNNQTVPLTGIAITTTGDFAVSATTCTTSLEAKAKCTISVTFTPTVIGKRTGQLSMADSAVNGPQTSNLTGTGK